MIRREFVRRKLHLIAEDLGRLPPFRDETLEPLTEDPVRLAAVERMLERIVMRAIYVWSFLARQEGNLPGQARQDLARFPLQQIV